MKAILLDGSRANGGTGERVRAALAEQFHAQHWDVDEITLREKQIGPCAGDFFCWIRTPGVCNVNDDNRAIAEALANSDLLVYLTPITFGGFSSTLKSMVDHQIQNLSPLFATIEGETHHRKRYRKNPDLLAAGWLDAPDGHAETVFRHLVQRVALDMRAETHASEVLGTEHSDGELAAWAEKALSELRNGRSSKPAELPADGDATTHRGAGNDPGPVKIRRALLLVGSPKTRKSSSNSLGSYLFDQLEARSIDTETIYLHTVLRSATKMQALLDALDAADLVTLAFPVYVDSLPAPVIEAMERIAAYRQGRDLFRRQLYAAVANCGFPEALQCNTSLAINEIFAREARFEWAGSLALGGGGMVAGLPLADGGGQTLRMRQSLDLAAEALAAGQPITDAAREMMAKPLIPHWAYRRMADVGWLSQARQYGALRKLGRRPYLEQAH